MALASDISGREIDTKSYCRGHEQTRYLVCSWLWVKPASSAHSDFSVAVAAIDWSTIARLKGHYGVLTTFGAFCRKHLALGSVAAAFAAIVFVSVLL